MNKIATLCIALTLSGCAVTKVAVPIGGSKSDGVVKMGFDYTGFENPNVNEEKIRADALERCKVWGYTKSEPFGSFIRTCTGRNNLGCTHFRVTIDFQCGN